MIWESIALLDGWSIEGAAPALIRVRGAAPPQAKDRPSSGARGAARSDRNIKRSKNDFGRIACQCLVN